MKPISFILLLCSLLVESKNNFNEGDYMENMKIVDEIKEPSTTDTDNNLRPPRIGREFLNSINKLESKTNPYEESRNMKVQYLNENVFALKNAMNTDEPKNKIAKDSALCDPSLNSQTRKNRQKLLSALHFLFQQLLKKP